MVNYSDARLRRTKYNRIRSVVSHVQLVVTVELS